HRVRHHQDQSVAFAGSGKSQANSRIAAGRLDQYGLARRNSPRLFGLFNHAHANAVFYAVAGIKTFKLGHHRRLGAPGHLLELNQRRPPDGLRNIFVYIHLSTFRFYTYFRRPARGNKIIRPGVRKQKIGSSQWELKEPCSPTINELCLLPIHQIATICNNLFNFGDLWYFRRSQAPLPSRFYPRSSQSIPDRAPATRGFSRGWVKFGVGSLAAPDTVR